jgi:hypothetical protein
MAYIIMPTFYWTELVTLLQPQYMHLGLDVLVHACNLRTQAVEAGGSEV